MKDGLRGPHISRKMGESTSLCGSEDFLPAKMQTLGLFINTHYLPSHWRHVGVREITAHDQLSGVHPQLRREREKGKAEKEKEYSTWLVQGEAKRRVYWMLEEALPNADKTPRRMETEKSGGYGAIHPEKWGQREMQMQLIKHSEHLVLKLAVWSDQHRPDYLLSN